MLMTFPEKNVVENNKSLEVFKGINGKKWEEWLLKAVGVIS